MKLLVASNNAKKRQELERIVVGLGLEVVTPKDVGIDLDPDESGSSFEENSRIKALAFAAATDLPVLADDSGLCVDALDGAPGVRSARFAGEDATDADNRRDLLSRLEGVPEPRRTARFVCVATLARRGEVIAQERGSCAGTILTRERGDGGFGYDPLFRPEAEDRTFAELPPGIKDRISHRGDALRRMKPHLSSLAERENTAPLVDNASLD